MTITLVMLIIQNSIIKLFKIKNCTSYTFFNFIFNLTVFSVFVTRSLQGIGIKWQIEFWFSVIIIIVNQKLIYSKSVRETVYSRIFSLEEQDDEEWFYDNKKGGSNDGF